MTWEIAGIIGELVGAIAVVVSLIYLASQIRQSTNAAQGTNELELSKDLAAWHGLPVTNDKLRSVWNKASAGTELTEDELSQLAWYVIEWFFLCEGWYRQYKRGLMSAEIWDTRARAALGLLSIKALDNYWEVIDAPLSPDFKEYISELKFTTETNWKPSNKDDFLKSYKR